MSMFTHKAKIAPIREEIRGPPHTIDEQIAIIEANKKKTSRKITGLQNYFFKSSKEEVRGSLAEL